MKLSFIGCLVFYFLNQFSSSTIDNLLVIMFGGVGPLFQCPFAPLQHDALHLHVKYPAAMYHSYLHKC
eukprot:m.202530 g.202530  ORF g.202530 m.202530 type:complete len:68 (+) comp13723_c0_seq6:388-591(+)